MNRFGLRPLADSVVVTPGENVEEYALTPGPSRQKTMYEGAVFLVQATVSLFELNRKRYFWAFWREYQRNPQPFIWAIETDGGEREDHVCQFVVGSFVESKRKGHVIAMSFQVRAVPIIRSADDDQKIIALWNKGMQDAQNRIHLVPNVWLPNAVGVDE